MVRDAHAARMPRPDGRTLSSILSLAAGAGALSTGGQADADTIVKQYFTPAKTVGFGGSDLASWSLPLPGAAGNIEIKASSNSDSQRAFVKAFGTAASGVTFGGQTANRSVNYPTTSLGNNVAFRTAGGVSASASTPNWNAADRTADLVAGAFIISSAYVITGTGPGPTYPYYKTWKGRGPGGFTDKYLLFKFTNTEQSAINYGWIHLASATRTVGDKTAMSVTIDGWAYRTDGQPIGAGQTLISPSAVPEIDPTAATSALAAAAGALSLLEQRRRRGAGEAMGGALVSGAAGLRRWREARATAAAARASGPAA